MFWADYPSVADNLGQLQRLARVFGGIRNGINGYFAAAHFHQKKKPQTLSGSRLWFQSG
jgi:hypothetical protein